MADWHCASEAVGDGLQVWCPGAESELQVGTGCTVGRQQSCRGCVSDNSLLCVKAADVLALAFKALQEYCSETRCAHAPGNGQQHLTMALSCRTWLDT